MQTYIVKVFSGALLIIGVLAAVPPAYATAQQSQVPQQEVSQGNASLNWSGYVAQNAGASYTSVSGSWIVPAVSEATPGTADATWVGIGGVKSQDLIQAGTQAVVQNGAITYNAWVETLPGFSQTVPVSVQAGDSISTSVTEQSAGVWLVTINNNTSGQHYQTTLNYNSSLSSVEWIEEMVSNGNNTFRPLDSFGSVSFSGGSATVDGVSENISQSGAQPLQMINEAGSALATVSVLGGDGASFSVARTSASASAQGAAGSMGDRPGRTGWRVVQTATSTGGTPQTITVYRRSAGAPSRFVQYQFILRFMQLR